MPTSPSNGYAWRGRRACQCVIDAAADYERLVKSSLIGYIYQACYSHADASAGTHSKGGALDTITLTDHGIRTASSIGFWPSNRYRWQGFMAHAHWVLFGCPHQSSSLDGQERALRNGRGGLASGAADLFRHLRPKKVLTYREWKASQRRPAKYIRLSATGVKLRDRIVTVHGINLARRKGKSSVYTYWCQVWLRRLGFYKSVIDAKWGPVTQAALDNFRLSLGWRKSVSVGPIGIASLTRLAKAAKTKKTIRLK